MKKISLEHSIRKIVTDAPREVIISMSEQTANTDSSEESESLPSMINKLKKIHLGPNAGPLGFGVYPQGVPSIENTKNLSPVETGSRPAELQQKQKEEDSKINTPPVRVHTSTPEARRRERTVRENYTSLEHSIRNIHNESVGNLVDPKQSHIVKAAFNKPVQIEPPEGEEHASMRAMNVSNQRKQVKQAESQTRDTFAEDVLSERAPRGAPHVPDEVLDLLPSFLKPPSVKPPTPTPTKPSVPVEVPPAPPAETPMVPKPVKPSPVKPSAPVEPAPVEIPGYETSPVKPGKVAPSKPAPTEVPGEPVPAKPSKVEPADTVAPKTDIVPKTDVTVPTKVAPKTDVAIPPKVAPKAGTKAPKTRLPFFGGDNSPNIGTPKDAPNTANKTYIHHASSRKLVEPSNVPVAVAKQILKKRAMSEEMDRKDIDLVARDKTERKKVEYVGRDKLNAQKTLGRQAAYKTNVIDEAEEIKPSRAKKIKSIVLDKKEENLGINPIVDSEPRLKPLHMAEQSFKEKALEAGAKVAGSLPARVVGRGTQLLGVGTGTAQMATGGDPLAMGPNFRTMGTGRKWLNPTKDVVPAMGSTTAQAAAAKTGSTALKTAARVVPGIQTIYGLGLAGYRAAKGDYTGAGLAATSAIPGPVGWAATAADIGRSVLSGDDEEKKPEVSKPEPTKPEQTPQKPEVPKISDTPAAQASEPNKNRSVLDPTPIKKQGM